MKILNTILYTLILNFLLITCLYSVPHINGRDFGPKEYARPKRTSKGAIAKTITTTGIRKVAVILVNFVSAGTDTSGSETMLTDEIFSLNYNFTYLKNFYKEVSYGKLDLDITFFYTNGSGSALTGNETPFTLNTPMSTYGQDTDSSLSQLIIDAIIACGQVNSINFDGVIVVHAGYGNESTNNSGDIWAAYVGPFSATNGFTEGINIPVKESGASPIGVLCHEFGHHLGLLDLYSTGTNSATQVGHWSLMDYGVWLGNGSTPMHPSGWEKNLLGWSSPISISSGTHNLISYAFETSSTSIYKMKLIDTDTEYFLVYHTSRTAYSPAPSGSNGLLIWHIDEGTIDGTTITDRIATNSLNNYSRRTIDVVSADNTDPSVNIGDFGDLWPGTKVIFSAPLSNKYNGDDTMLSVFEITNAVQYSQFKASYKPFIRGYVKDSAGNGVESVNIILTGFLTDVSVTDNNGSYVFANVENGSYEIKAIKSGLEFVPSKIVAAILDLPSSNNNFNGIATDTYSNLIKKTDNIKAVNNLFVPGQQLSTIYYRTSEDGNVNIKLYTLDGRFIKTLVDEYTLAGIRSVTWDGKNLKDNEVSSGIYLVHIDAPGFKATKKICVIR
ncbi:MAG: hypothetical protein A2474_04395 [Elusimicrobia bacterium RIFOXYC2_FULL_34_12]|nr:MAG: hypothetical protein A2474_04395 [Elusimicrobia bacterium RIFOXYC2_FULL_34_12]OGS39361.1 MAG: hypothetical protein A2551_01920 [Elusimicrobia bacterium RIFOXYD2_FULL_34_30]HAM37889.1 hypothetical protein [Elusimicrobiota bacterium]